MLRLVFPGSERFAHFLIGEGFIITFHPSSQILLLNFTKIDSEGKRVFEDISMSLSDIN